MLKKVLQAGIFPFIRFQPGSVDDRAGTGHEVV